MRSLAKHVGCSIGLALPLLLSTLSPSTAAPTSTQEAIDIAISPKQPSDARVEAANLVTEGWRDSLPLLLQNIETYYRGGEAPPYAADATARLVPLTDLLVRIVVNQDGAVQRFREIDTEKTIDLLAASAGGTERDLRFNASYILAKVVDDGNLCVVLHRLRDPDLGYSGQVNLLQIAISGTSSTARENVRAAKATAEQLKGRTEGKTAVLVSLLDQIANSRVDVPETLPADSYCARYNVDTGIAGAAPSEGRQP